MVLGNTVRSVGYVLVWSRGHRLQTQQGYAEPCHCMACCPWYSTTCCVVTCKGWARTALRGWRSTGCLQLTFVMRWLQFQSSIFVLSFHGVRCNEQVRMKARSKHSWTAAFALCGQESLLLTPLLYRGPQRTVWYLIQGRRRRLIVWPMHTKYAAQHRQQGG
jgi:hypothetical protein